MPHKRRTLASLLFLLVSLAASIALGELIGDYRLTVRRINREPVRPDNPLASRIQRQMTLEIWLKPEKVPNEGETIIASAGFPGAFAMTYDAAGKCNFYFAGRTCAAPLPIGQWSHVAGVAGEDEMRLYLNGRLVAWAPSGGEVSDRQEFTIGAAQGGFAGWVHRVRLHDAALDNAAILQSYQSTIPREALATPAALAPAFHIENDRYSVSCAADGATRIDVASARFFIQSRFSFPGDEAIGFHALPNSAADDEQTWNVKVSQQVTGAVEIKATEKLYTLTRTITPTARRITITDEFRNTSDHDLGILIDNSIVTDDVPARVLLAGVPQPSLSERPENPTALIELNGGKLGVVGEDTISRGHFDASVNLNRTSVSIKHFAVQGGKTQTLTWACYPLAASEDYWTFVNAVRADWGVNQTIEGPFEFGPPSQVWSDPKLLKQYLRRKPIRLAALTPWLDYDNFNSTTGQLMSREEMTRIVADGIRAMRSADPGIRLIGLMEGPFVSVPVDLSQRLYDALPEDQRGQYYPKIFTERQLQILNDHRFEQADSFPIGPNGERFYELYFRGPDRTPLIALLVYPAPGNSRLKSWLEQAQFFVELGLDGVYIDGGGPVAGGRYGYDRWDGVTVDIDSTTGKITRKYLDYLRVISDTPFRSLSGYLQSRDRLLIANGQPYAQEMQSLPAIRFIETGGAYDPLANADGEVPPLTAALCVPHLGHPVALANHPGHYGERAEQQYAKFVMKSVITHLRHGLLYYYYNTEIPAEGPGSGEYGPISHMFPLTPLELHEGWIVGKERIVAARSIDVIWECQSARPPTARIFDLEGREVESSGSFTAEKTPKGWHVRLQLKDWQQIAVIEQSLSPIIR